MHRVHCEVALLKLLRQKMRRKTKTCYCVRFVTPSYDTSQLINVVETKRISKKKFFLPIFIITFEGERIYILQCQDRKTTTFVGITKFQIISSGRRHHGLFSKT